MIEQIGIRRVPGRLTIRTLGLTFATLPTKVAQGQTRCPREHESGPRGPAPLPHGGGPTGRGTHEANACFFGSAVALALAAGAASARDARRREGPRHAEVRHQHRPRRLRRARTPTASGRASTSPSAARSPRRSSATPRRSSSRPTTGETRFTALASGEIDVLVAQLHLDLQPRRRPEVHLRRRQLLRRPGLHGVEGPRRHLGQGARRRHRLHPDRHHHRAQPRRLLQGQRHHLPAGADPDERRGRPAVPGRRLRRLHHRRLRPRRQPRHLRESRRTGSSCRRSSPRSRSGRWCARATTSGPTSCAGR